MKPSNDPQLQLPLFSPEGYRVKVSSGEYVLLVPGGKYKGLIFTEVDFTAMTIKADFSGATFSHCRFVMADFSGSTFSSALFDDCHISESAFMWTKSDDVKFSNTLVDETRFAYSNLSRAQFVSDTTLHDCKFNNARLDQATFDHSVIADCKFYNTVAQDVTIHDSCLAQVRIVKSNFLGLKISDSLVDELFVLDSNLSGSSWHSVTSENGRWRFWKVDFTASLFSLCDAKDSAWTSTTLFGVVMERCNWFQSKVRHCNFAESTLNSVGWNETKFKSVCFTNLKASALRLRFAEFTECTLIDSTIADSSFEFCELSGSVVHNLQIVRPAWSEETKWHEGYSPDTQPNITD